MVYVWVGKRGRDVIGELSLEGFTNVEDAKAALVAYLRDEGPSGDAGSVTDVQVSESCVVVETTGCGFAISDSDIEKALSGKTVHLYDD